MNKKNAKLEDNVLLGILQGNWQNKKGEGMGEPCS